MGSGGCWAQVPETLIPKQYVPVLDDDFEKRPWQEIEAQFPPPPQEKYLLPFYVSAVNSNSFRVDSSSLSVGSDGVIRYVLVVETSGGARNVSFEGLRCSTAERRLYAVGRSDGAWIKARASAWSRVSGGSVNAHHAALFRDYFCPGGVPLRNAEEGVAALRLGRHPDTPR